MDMQLACTDLGRLPEVKTLLGRATGHRQLADGVVVEFPGEDATARIVLEFVLAERRCCPHFTYEVGLAGDRAHVTLTLRASAEYLEALKALYASFHHR